MLLAGCELLRRCDARALALWRTRIEKTQISSPGLRNRAKVMRSPHHIPNRSPHPLTPRLHSFINHPRMPTTRMYELTDGTSNKFWEIT